MENNNNSNNKRSKTILAIVVSIGIFVVLLLILWAGMLIGYMKAGYSYRFGENYYRNFGGPKQGESRGFGMMRDEMMSGHGVAGKVIKINPPTIIAEGTDNVEKIIKVTDDTQIRKFRDSISVNEIKVGDTIVVIGNPNGNGEIEAELVRVMPFPEINPTASSTSGK